VDVERLGLERDEPAVLDQDGAQLTIPFAADPAVPPGTAWLPLGLPGFDVRRVLGTGRSVSHILIRPGGGA
jgi:hypothetical protein